MKALYALISVALLAGCATTQTEEPIVVLISIDGLGADMLAAVETPVLDALAAGGLSAGRMRPVFPTLTFPNHYSIATGLHPAEHGIVGNTFPNRDRDDWYTLRDRSKVQDGRWYGGDPVWVLAEQNGLTAMSYYFVGTEADINGVKPTVAFDFDPDVSGTERVDTVLGWLALPEAERPRMITLYFEDVDVAAHDYGPAADETIAAIAEVEAYLRRLFNGASALPASDRVHYVVVSDHGQAAYLKDQPVFILDSVVDLGDARIIEGGAYLNLFDASLSDGDADAICAAVNDAWEHGRCFTHRTAPAAWRVTDDTRFPDVFMIADEGHALISSEDRRDKLKRGDHGWPPEAGSMQAIFIASGPTIAAGERIASIRSIDVYPFLLELLGLAPPRPIPDDQRVLLDFIKSN